MGGGGEPIFDTVGTRGGVLEEGGRATRPYAAHVWTLFLFFWAIFLGRGGLGYLVASLCELKN